MASNGLLRKAKRGTCRICQRNRQTATQLKTVGEVRRGFATGHIWECNDSDECIEMAKHKLTYQKLNILVRNRIVAALERGPLKEYVVITR